MKLDGKVPEYLYLFSHYSAKVRIMILCLKYLKCYVFSMKYAKTLICKFEYRHHSHLRWNMPNGNWYATLRNNFLYPLHTQGKSYLKVKTSPEAKFKISIFCPQFRHYWFFRGLYVVGSFQNFIFDRLGHGYLTSHYCWWFSFSFSFSL